MADSASQRQKKLYEAIHDDYEDHYYDTVSMEYRDRYYYDPIFSGLNLNKRAVADLAAGSGHNSLIALKRFPEVELTGFDISSKACASYNALVQRPAIESDLTKPFSHSEQFDAAMIFGGLHHCVADIPATLTNISNLLKPGGMFLMLEPNRCFFLEVARKLWYRMDDKYFDAATEAALDHRNLCELGRKEFTPIDIQYLGGPAYFLLAQSLLFRLPKGAKTALKPPLLLMEEFYNLFSGEHMSPYFIARWRKKAG